MHNNLEYDEDDLLTKAELNQIAINLAIKYLKDKGYQILGSKADYPLQIKALRYGLRYLVVVLYRLDDTKARMSYLAKDSFVKFALASEVTPCLLTMNIHSTNELHYLKGVAKSDDEFICDYQGLELLSDNVLPTSFNKLYVLELVKEAFRRQAYEELDNLCSDNLVLNDDLIDEVIKTKTKVIEYLKQAEETKTHAYLVNSNNKEPRILVMHEDQTSDFFVDITFNDNNLIDQINLSEYDLEDYLGFYEI